MNTRSASPLGVHNLRCEYQANPLGIDVVHPRLSWKLVSDRRSIMQSAYQIRVRDENGDLWDTGKAMTDQSIHVPYSGPALQSGYRYTWQARAWDDTDQPSAWSDTAWWEMGLLQASDWHANWIEPGWDEDPKGSKPCPYLRTTFHANGSVASARVYITAHGLYELSINEQRVGDAFFTPGYTSYQHRLQYQTYDITALLHTGENVVGVILGDGWYRGNVSALFLRNVYGDRLALLLQLHIRYADGREQFVLSDEQWQATTGPILSSDLKDGEVYDARLEMPGWDQPGFDASGWRSVSVVNHDKDHLVATIGPLVRCIAEVTPVGIITTPNGETVVDIGQNFAGIVRLKVQGEAGITITLRHGETLDKHGNFTMDNLQAPLVSSKKLLQAVRYTLKGGGEEVYTPHFTYHGFRYVQVEGFPGTGFLSTPYLCHILSENGRLNVAYELLNQETFPSWLYEVKKGATTIWEAWDGIREDGTPNQSLNHDAFGAIGSWLYQVVAGIEIGAPGYKQIIFQPHPGGGLTSARATYHSLYGEIASSWQLVDGMFTLTVTVPPNTTATVRLPAAVSEQVTEGGQALDLVEGVNQVRQQGDTTVIDVGSGTYSFSYPYGANG